MYNFRGPFNCKSSFRAIQLAMLPDIKVASNLKFGQFPIKGKYCNIVTKYIVNYMDKKRPMSPLGKIPGY